MKPIKLTKIAHIKDYILELTFDDGCVKQFDFYQLIEFKGIAERLKNTDYFKTVEILDGARSFGWDNGYDCCADWARYFARDLDNEWEGYDDTTTLSQRIKIARQKLKRQVEVVS